MRGQVGYLTGIAAEDAVERHYRSGGYVIVASRWRCAAGEIDLVVRHGDVLVFVEVKKSSTHAKAAERLTQRQMTRILAAASEFLAGEPAGQMTESRFDVALVNAMGQIEFLENAFGA
ncbi:MAG: YraN family protein [Gemmobacter sp.]|nr:YraN family protein [Gemmobacter sp.]